MIVQFNKGAIVAEKITCWDIWSYPDFPTTENPQGWLEVQLEGTHQPVVVFVGPPDSANQLLRELPAWVDYCLKHGYEQIDLDAHIEALGVAEYPKPEGAGA